MLRVPANSKQNYWLKTTNYRPCPLCNGRDFLLLSNRMQFKLNLTTVICKGCGLVFTNPLPPQETYELFYLEAYEHFYKYTVSRPADGFGDKEPLQLKQRLDWLETVRPLTGMRLLEVGPGRGRFLWFAQRRGATVMGVEPSPTLSKELVTLGLPCVCSSFENLQLQQNEVFDMIVMLHVLEHFYDPNSVIKKCRGMLSENGLLVVEVPNILKPFRSLDHYFLRYVHPFNFSSQTLRAMLRKHGFRVRIVDEGGDDWRSPQSLFAIAYRGNGLPHNNTYSGQSADEVHQILQNYRRHWLCYLGVAWHIHRLFLKGRKLAYWFARRIKHMIFDEKR